MMNKKTLSEFFAGSQQTRIAVRQITHPNGFCLVVEDDPNVAKYLKKVLSKKGLDTRIVDNSQDALNILSKEETEIICAIIDLNLEKKNSGQLVVEEFERGHRDIPYVVYTADMTREATLKKRFPHINVAIKGRNNTQVILGALGLL